MPIMQARPIFERPEIDFPFADGDGKRLIVDDVPSTGPIDRETLDPGDYILWYCPVWNDATNRYDLPSYMWLRVNRRLDTFALCGDSQMQVPYNEMLAASYASIHGAS